jgi:DNA-directed RNA polymerase sigma subunit (sigma70/sigma32)
VSLPARIVPVSPALRSIVLAFQIEQAVKEGRARDYADVARQIGMTRARVSQIMRLLRLPTNLLESVLLADPKQFAKLTERQLRSYATNPAFIPQLEELTIHGDPMIEAHLQLEALP